MASNYLGKGSINCDISSEAVGQNVSVNAFLPAFINLLSSGVKRVELGVCGSWQAGDGERRFCSRILGGTQWICGGGPTAVESVDRVCSRRKNGSLLC